MVSTWPLKVTVDRLRRIRAMRLQHLVDVVGRAIQIAPLHIGVHVEYRPDVELRGDHGHRLAPEGGQIEQQLTVGTAAPPPEVTGRVCRSCDRDP